MSSLGFFECPSLGELFWGDIPVGSDVYHFTFYDLFGAELKVDGKCSYLHMVAKSHTDLKHLGVLKDTQLVLHLPYRSFRRAWCKASMDRFRSDQLVNCTIKFSRPNFKSMFISSLDVWSVGLRGVGMFDQDQIKK